MHPIKPLYLLADSQLLFLNQGKLVREWQTLIQKEGASNRIRASYLGASNGDKPEFFNLFEGACSVLDDCECRHVKADPTKADLDFLKESDMILLAGGNPYAGWRAFKKAGMEKILYERFYAGAVLVGISAGAIQLGLHGWKDTENWDNGFFDGLKLAPFLVDVHDEPEWQRLSESVEKLGNPMRGIGIPSGGGLRLHEDKTIEQIRKSLSEFTLFDDDLKQAVIGVGEEV